MEVLYGLHPVEEALRARAGAIDHIAVAQERQGRGDPRLARVVELARAAGVRVTQEPREQLARRVRAEIHRAGMHQGVVAFLRERRLLELEDLLETQPDASGQFFLALDGVEDPHNLGALLRSADGAGVAGVILPERRTAPLSAVVARSSAGASEHVRIARVTNLTRALEQMKKRNIWIVGLDERGTPDYFDFDLRQDCCLVLGREGAGLHELVKRTCDFMLRIPMAGSVASLNVSVAGAVVMYEAMRQRRSGAVGARAESKMQGSGKRKSGKQESGKQESGKQESGFQRPRKGLGS